MVPVMGDWTFMLGSFAFKEARPVLSSVKRTSQWVEASAVPSLRRHDPDQVRRVAASAASQPLKRDTPENADETTLSRRGVKRRESWTAAGVFALRLLAETRLAGAYSSRLVSLERPEERL
jgi:hypothetical protein